MKHPSGGLGSWIGRALIILGVWAAVGLFLQYAVMPLYTRQGTEIKVPNVVGMQLNDARREFGRKGFKLVVDDQRYEAEIPPGTILDQLPPPGGWTKKGRRIHLAVAAGVPTSEVPDMAGETRDDAIFHIQSAGLKLVQVGYAFSEDVYEGQVISQSPLSGSIVEKQTDVRIVVSLGPEPTEIVVPKLIDLPEEQARYLVIRSGLEVGEVEHDRYVNRKKGAVVLQTPPAGAKANRGDFVDLVVNQK